MNKITKILLPILLIPFAANAYETNAKHAVLLEFDTNTILFEKDADAQMVPSSMTKLMTTYIIFERLHNGVLKLDDKFNVSEKAWRKGGSKMFVKYNEPVSIEELLNGIIIQSGNDACIVAAEGISGSEEAFAGLMNKTAKELGLTNSNFKNSTGWPDEGHYMSARDLAILSKSLIKNFPEYYHYFSKKSYTFSNITQSNRNRLLHRDIGVDGLKTGHTEAAGYGIVVSGKQEGRRLITVVNGLTSDKERADESERLLNYGFRYFENKKVFTSGQEISTADVWQGTEETVPLVIKEDVIMTLPKLNTDKINIDITYESPLQAPIYADSPVAKMTVTFPESNEKREFTLYTGKEINRAGLVSRIIKTITDKAKQ